MVWFTRTVAALACAIMTAGAPANAAITCPEGEFIATGSNTGLDGWRFNATSSLGEITDAAGNFCGFSSGWTLSGSDPEYDTGFVPAGCFGGGQASCAYVIRLTDPNNLSLCISWSDGDGVQECSYDSAAVPVDLMQYSVE